MSLNKNEINPLNVLGFRKLNFVPAHFDKISLNDKIDLKLIEHWIEYNLNSRYGVQFKFKLDLNKKVVRTLEIGIEDPKELTMFSLGCPYLHNIKKEY